MESYRIHRSGNTLYEAPKRRPIPLTFKTWSRKMSKYSNKMKIRFMWRFRIKEDIIERMNVICAGHPLTIRWNKVPMIVEWLKHKDSDPQIRIDMKKYGGEYGI